MESKQPSLIKTPEHALIESSLVLDQDVKKEAFRRAELLGDEYVQLTETLWGVVLEKAMALKRHISLLRQIDFGTTTEFNKDTESHVEEALRLSIEEYDRTIAETIQDANNLIESRPGAFSINGLQDSIILSLDIQPDEQQVLRLHLQTTRGPVVLEGAILDIDLRQI